MEPCSAIREARHSISLTYIRRRSVSVMGLLEERAAPVSKCGCCTMLSARLTQSSVALLASPTCPTSARWLLQANILKRKFQINPRNHRKILVIDGKEAFTGGINFYDIYLKRRNEEATIDYHSRARPIALELQYTFLRDWYYATDQPSLSELLPRPLPCAAKAGETAVRLQTAAPPCDESETADTASGSTRRAAVLIVTIVFVPPEPLILAFRQAAYRGGGQVLVPSTNNPMVNSPAGPLRDPAEIGHPHLRKTSAVHPRRRGHHDNTAIIGSRTWTPQPVPELRDQPGGLHTDFAALSRPPCYKTWRSRTK